MAGSEQVTMADVAERAGVSRSAVTAAFSERASTAVIRDDTRRRILSTAEQMGYRPNILSRSFIKQQSFLIGMLGREAFFVYALETIKGIEDVLEETDYSLLMFYHGDWADTQATHLQKCNARRVDGLIIVPSPEPPDGPNHQKIRHLQDRGVPVVQLYRQIYPGVPVAMTDENEIGYLSARHLIELGHRRIAHVTHSEYRDIELSGTHLEARDRARGYERAMREAGYAPKILTFTRSGYFGLGSNDYAAYCMDVAKELRDGTDRFTAATTFSDYTAIGLIHCLNGLGVRVPDDISLVGYDNIEAGALIRPALTTFAPSAMEIGRAAARMILDMIKGKPAADAVFPPRIQLRESAIPQTKSHLSPRHNASTK